MLLLPSGADELIVWFSIFPWRLNFKIGIRICGFLPKTVFSQFVAQRPFTDSEQFRGAGLDAIGSGQSVPDHTPLQRFHRNR